MSPTANMGLVLPIDHSSADQWDVILDTVFGLIDSHDHSTGKGVKIPASALNINADVSWSSGGVSRSITDLIAVDFQPGAATGVVGLAGALFLNSADNELYWRTTAGTNVKMTAGAALNVAAFTGGIGGDYASTGALVVFDDATDSYWFQQQVGASVRQYARMRSADVDLYEFKANPTAGVPTNRVRLASPAALAASYALTMPAALPASTKPVQIDSSGNVSNGYTNTLTFAPALAAFPAGSAAIFAASGNVVILQTATNPGANCPVVLPVGATIVSWTIFWSKTQAGTIQSQLLETNMSTGANATIGANQTNAVTNPGFITLGQVGLSAPVQSGRAYQIQAIGSGNSGDSISGWQIGIA